MDSVSQTVVIITTIMGGLAAVLTFVLQFAKASETERAKVFSWSSKALSLLLMASVIVWFSWTSIEYALTPGQPSRWETAMFAVSLFNVLMYTRFLFEAVLNLTVRKDRERRKEEHEQLQLELVRQIAKNEAQDMVIVMLNKSLPPRDLDRLDPQIS